MSTPITVNTAIDPRVAKDLATQLQCAAEEIAELREKIGSPTTRPAQLPDLAQRLQDELAYQSQLRLIETILENEANEQQDPRLVLLAQLRELAEATRRVADNGRNESKDVIEARGLALRAATNAVYYALYDDLREGK